jgi:hypothetical protein
VLTAEGRCPARPLLHTEDLRILHQTDHSFSSETDHEILRTIWTQKAFGLWKRSEDGESRASEWGLDPQASQLRICRRIAERQEFSYELHTPDAEWYLAEIVEEFRIAGETQNIVHTNLVLVRADSP